VSNQQYDNEMRGVLFINKDRTNPKAPNAKGRCQIGGVVYWMSAWTQTKQDGEKYQQIRYERAKDEYQPGAQASAGGAAPAPAVTPTPDEEIPF
jgi:hypothetical protein